MSRCFSSNCGCRMGYKSACGFDSQMLGMLHMGLRSQVSGLSVDICTHALHALYARVAYNIINYNLFHPSISTEHFVAHGII